MENTVVKLLNRALVVLMICGSFSAFSNEDPSGLEGVFEAMLSGQENGSEGKQLAEKKNDTSELDGLFGDVFNSSSSTSAEKADTRELDSLFAEIMGSGGDGKAQNGREFIGDNRSANGSSVGDPSLQQLFIQIESSEEVLDRDRLLSGEAEASLLGELLSSMEEEVQEEEGLPGLLGEEGINDIGLEILTSTLAIIPTDEESIFEPIPASYDFTDQVAENKGRYGISFSVPSANGYGEGALLGGMVQHILTNKLYAAAEVQYLITQLNNPDVGEVKENTAFSTIGAGIEYAVARGLGALDSNSYFPWEITLKSIIGQQYTGGSQGLYLGIGSSILFNMDSYWVSGDVRYFYVDDDNLNLYKTFSGLQVGFTVGLYY